ncbi:M3 family metallopeptidase [Mesobacillus foraminis]|uniref:M3 family metallopeptidase n=1 Tax=Mesobacillus foraminis TaxID=279826 RepID=UPI0039A3B2D8
MNLMMRKDVPVEETWDLTDIFPSDLEWESAYAAAEQELDIIIEGEISLLTSAEVLDFLRKYDDLMGKLERISSYGFFKYSEDESDPVNQKLMGRSQLLDGKGKKVSAKLINGLLQIPKEVMAQYVDEEKDLLIYGRFLQRVEETQKYTLPSDMEEILASLDRTLATPESIYLMVTSSDLTFEPVKDGKGKEVPVSLHMYMTQIETSPDTVLRRNAYHSLTKALQNYQHGLAKTLASEVNKNVSLAKLRGFPSALDMHLQFSPASNNFYTTDEISTEFFEQILDTFQPGLSPHMQKYAELRKNQLGLDKLLFSDVKAPLDPDFNPAISYQEAGEIITEAVGVLGSEFQNEMRKAFTDRWVYRGDNAGRRMIAFGGGVHGVHGYSFYPWGGSLFDMLLLSHELGHTIHYSLSAQNQRVINNAQSMLFVEAPSTLVEHLVIQYLRKHRNEPRLLRWLNMYLIMSYHHNCVTHVLEAELLRRLYKTVENNEPLTTSIISDTKGNILSTFWGETVEIDEGAKLTWMRQPHYYMGLYPFTYSVGMSAATVLAHRIKEEGVRLGEQWTNVLKQGGNRKGLDLYKMAGIDLSATDIFNQTVDYVGAIVDELERSF